MKMTAFKRKKMHVKARKGNECKHTQFCVVQDACSLEQVNVDDKNVLDLTGNLKQFKFVQF